LGYQAFLLIQIETSIKSYIKEIVDSLSKVPYVHDIIRISGTYDLEIVVHVKDCFDIMTIHKEIAKIPHVKRIESSLAHVFPIWPPRRTTITTF
jgi:DNA-binding Lrp family transcriptional regulator